MTHRDKDGPNALVSSETQDEAYRIIDIIDPLLENEQVVPVIIALTTILADMFVRFGMTDDGVEGFYQDLKATMQHYKTEHQENTLQ